MSPTTPIYALPYPAAADPADVPLDMQELAERVEAVFPVQPVVRVYHAGAIVGIASSAWVTVPFDSETLDTHGSHDPVTNNYRLTCKLAGVYAIYGRAHWGGSAAGTVRELRMNTNTGTVIDWDRRAPQGAAAVFMAVQAFWKMAVNDWVSLEVSQDSGGTLVPGTSAPTSPSFGMVRLAAG